MTLSNGQSTTTGSWEAYFSYNSIKDIEIGSDIIYAASENAIFTYDPNTNSIETITTIEGLSGDYITTIKYSENYNLLMIGYETGLMEVYDLNTNTVLKVVDILNQITIPPNNRRINNFYEFDNLVYISTNYGISIYDMQSLEFGDTYYIGFNGTQTRVHQITLNNNEIYAATSDGLKKANLNNPNLIDFQFWQTPFLGDFLSVISIADQVFTIKSDNILYAVNDNSLSPVLSFTEPILRLESNETNFSIITANTVYYYQPDLSLINSYNNSSDLNTTFTTSKIFNNIIYIGTLSSGMLKISNNSNDLYEKIIPNGPLRNNPFSLHFGYGDLWVTFGDYDEDFNPNPNREYGFSFLESNIWTNISYDSIQQNIEKPVYNLNAIAINPVNSDQVFISSFQHGLLKFEKNNSLELFDDTNSALQSLVLVGSNYKSIRVSDLKFDNQGSLWSLTSLVEEPLKKFNLTTNQWQTYSFSSIIDNPILDENGFGPLVIGPDGTKWVGSYRNGVIGFNENGNLIRQIEGEDVANLPINHIKSLALDNNNVLWIGTYKGLRILYNTSNYFTEDVITTSPIIFIEDGLPKELLELQFITAIIVDGSNNKWISTVDSGVFYLSSDGQNTIYHFTKDNSPLPSNGITSMAQNQNDGTIYFGTNRGLVAFRAGGSSPSNSLEDAYAYPNPVRPSFNIEIDKIKIKNLSENINIKITDIEGNLVAEAQSNTNLRFKGYNLEIDGGTAYWNGKNLADRAVASGVYVVLISDLNTIETNVLKIMLIRK
ncbi:MAG: ABC transporter substrate-binding protein [Flavobacteriaceae bacterium]|nr:ABC transporter substrate-binding protein [Flavobacteriaceae bacterium]